jgi:hypothetical protein
MTSKDAQAAERGPEKDPTPAATITEPRDDADCMACGHPASRHDRIARRYCDASISHAVTRGCICGPL